jgi:hypothetical protein
VSRNDHFVSNVVRRRTTSDFVRSCRGNLTILQTTEIVGGSGAFAAASGSFLSTLSGKANLARNADRSCAFDVLPLHEEDMIELVGTLTF